MTKKPDLVLYVGSRDELFFVNDGKFEKPRERQRPRFGPRPSPAQFTRTDGARANEFRVDRSPPVQPIVNTTSFMWSQTPSVQPQPNTYCYMWTPVTAVQPQPTMPSYVYPQSSPEAVDASIRTSSGKSSSGSTWHTQLTNSFNSASGNSWSGCDVCNSAESNSWFDEQLREADELPGTFFW